MQTQGEMVSGDESSGIEVVFEDGGSLPPGKAASALLDGCVPVAPVQEQRKFLIEGLMTAIGAVPLTASGGTVIVTFPSGLISGLLAEGEARYFVTHSMGMRPISLKETAKLVLKLGVEKQLFS